MTGFGASGGRASASGPRVAARSPRLRRAPGSGAFGFTACARVLGGDAAQATVEMAVTAPVLIVLALIVFNTMSFASAVARFDRVAPDIVLAHGVSPEGDGGMAAVDAVESHLGDAMEGYDLEIEVTCEDAAADGSMLSLVGGLRTYRCTMRYAPWPSGLSIAGVDLGAPALLSHERSVTVDPWRPGAVM